MPSNSPSLQPGSIQEPSQSCSFPDNEITVIGLVIDVFPSLRQQQNLNEINYTIVVQRTSVATTNIENGQITCC